MGSSGVAGRVSTGWVSDSDRRTVNGRGVGLRTVGHPQGTSVLCWEGTTIWFGFCRVGREGRKL